ncbi:MAG: glycosyltransferase [Bacteroidetes bacterium]|nr:glycosyltransferase [Bacteroidota bacterium]
MATTDIAFVLTGDLHRNIRALKQIRSLSDGGFSVKVFHLGGNAAKTALPKLVSEQVVRVPSGRGPLYFRRIHQAFHLALQGVNARLYHASDLYVLKTCAKSAKRANAKYSFDSRELYAHVAATAGRPWVRWYWSRLERRLLPGSAGLFTVSDSIADFLARTYGVSRPIVIHNVPEMTNEGALTHEISGVFPGDGLPVFVHLGQMKIDRGCEQLVEAMTLVDDAHLVFLGFGPIQPKLEALVAAKMLQSRVHFVPPVGPREVQAALRGATVGVTMLEDTCLNHRFALPNKLFDYIRAGLPILGSNLVEVAQVVQQNTLGRTADPSDHRAIAPVMNEMKRSPDLPIWSKNASALSETFSWENASQAFMQEMNRILS